jgi:UDP-sulfoquinovose synthase
LGVLATNSDGCCGWPMAFHWSDANHDVVIVDEFVRRRSGEKPGTRSLTAVANLSTCLEALCR